MPDVSDTILKAQVDSYGKYQKVDGNPRYRKSWAFVQQRFPAPARVLDVGCADGGFSAPLVQAGYECYGLEYVDEAVEESRARGIIVSRGSFLDSFPFDDASFDVVFAGEVVEHTIDDQAFLREVRRVLRPGGLCVITTPNLVSLGNRMLMSSGRLPRFAYADFHYRIYTADLITSKMTSAGLAPVHLDSSYILVSTAFAARVGRLGERLGSLAPRLGEHFILFAQRS